MADDDSELRNMENWDIENAERVRGRRGRRTIVSVAFSKDDFQRVAEHSASAGMRVSEFIRNAALQQAGVIPNKIAVVLAGASRHAMLIQTNELPPLTSGHAPVRTAEPDQVTDAALG